MGGGANRRSAPRAAALAGPAATDEAALGVGAPALPLPFFSPAAVVVEVVDDEVDDDDVVDDPPTGGTGTVVTVVTGAGDVVVVVDSAGWVVVVVSAGPVVVVVSVGWPVGPVPSLGGGAIGLAVSLGSAGRSVAVPRPTSTSSTQVRPGRRRAYLPSSPRGVGGQRRL